MAAHAADLRRLARRPPLQLVSERAWAAFGHCALYVYLSRQAPVTLGATLECSASQVIFLLYQVALSSFTGL
jgi:hypothetical protein